MKKRTVLLGIALTVLTSLLVACSSKQGEVGQPAAGSNAAPVSAKLVELDYWNVFTGPDGQGMANLVEQFNKEFAGRIKVTAQSIPGGEYYDKIVTAVASNKAPDVGIMHVDNVQRFAKRGILVPLEQEVKAMGLDRSQYIPAAWDGSQFDGHQYGIPLDFHPLALYYNVDLLQKAGFKEPPKTRDEFVKMAKAATDAAKGQYGYMVQVGWPSQMILASAIYQNGGSLYSEDGQTPVYSSPEAVKSLQFLHDLIYVDKVSPENVPVDGGVTAFRQGKLLFHIDGIWMMQGFKDQAGLNFSVAPIDSILGDKAKAVWGGSHQFVLYNQKKTDAEKRKAALTFVEWIGKHSVEWAKWGQVPARNEVREGAEFKALKEQATLALQVPNAKFMVAKNNPFAPQGFDPIVDQMNLVLTNKADAKSALDQAMANGKKAIEAAKQGN